MGKYTGLFFLLFKSLLKIIAAYAKVIRNVGFITHTEIKSMTRVAQGLAGRKCTAVKLSCLP